jgi:hypothetical protein
VKGNSFCSLSTKGEKSFSHITWLYSLMIILLTLLMPAVIRKKLECPNKFEEVRINIPTNLPLYTV